MTKGSYSVGDNNHQPSRRDTSYKSFICVLLIFLFICLVILLAAIGWGSGRNYNNREKVHKETSNQEDESQAEVLERKGLKQNNTFEKIIVVETTTLLNKIANITEKAESSTIGLKATTEDILEETTVYLVGVNKEFSTSGTVEENTKKSLEPVTSSTALEEATTEDILKETAVYLVSVNKEFSTSGAVEENTKKSLEPVTSSIASEEIEVTTQEIVVTTDYIQQKLITNLEKLNTTQVTETVTSGYDQNLVDEKFVITTTEFSETNTLAPVATKAISEKNVSTENLAELLSTSTDKANSAPTFPTSTTEVSVMESEAITESIPEKTHSALTRSSNPVCESIICKTTSSRILSMMNHSADACDDFYEFACGRVYEVEEESVEFYDAEVLTNQMNLIKDSSPKYLKDFKQFYQSCLQHEDDFNYRPRMNKLEFLLKEVGEFQFGDDSIEVDLTDLVAQLLLRQSMPLFDIGLDVDKHTSNLILQLTLPQQSFLRTGTQNWSGLSLLKKQCLKKLNSLIRGSHVDLNETYKLYQKCHHNYRTYLNSIEFLMRELKAFQNLTSEVLFKEIVATRQNIEFEVLNNLDSLPSTADILRQFIQKKYEVRKLSDLKFHYPILDWIKLFQTMTGRIISENTVIQIYFSDYFKQIFSSLSKIDKKKLNNALLAIYAYDLYINTVVPKEKFTREKFCTGLSKQLFPEIWSHLVHNSISVEEQEKLNNQVDNIFGVLKKNFCKKLLTAEWIDDDTRTSVVTKCNNLNLIFFTPSNETTLINNYENVNVTSNFQTNLINSLIHFKQRIYSTQETPISAKTLFSYFVDPLDSKLLTFYSNSLIAVPLGLMRKAPESLPNYLIMSRVGLALARQIALHFDPTGLTYGIKLKSFSKSTYSEFVETMKNLMDYSSPRLFDGRNISFSLNGLLSMNERIVDNTAFRLVFDSLNLNPDQDILPWISAQYSREKVFFIATAQEFCKKTTILDFMLHVFEKRHLPAVLRVENIMGNSEDFANKFTCPDGSGMDFYVKLQFPYLNKVEEEYEDEEALQQNK
ncbi:neprilysin-11-like [Tribolium madens]|uniref:neprilysin-11-like n=1 Tax=Tribolium madens TaxID=41895 RepID=UPI001CF71F42|nr:neprilysin-11-like [Tribolium madens]